MYREQIALSAGILCPGHGEALVSDLLTQTDIGDGDVPLSHVMVEIRDSALDRAQLNSVSQQPPYQDSWVLETRGVNGKWRKTP